LDEKSLEIVDDIGARAGTVGHSHIHGHGHSHGHGHGHSHDHDQGQRFEEEMYTGANVIKTSFSSALILLKMS
jgi:hypothetical protein